MKLRVSILTGAVASILLSNNTLAQPLGASSTLGSTTSQWSLATSSHNPASSFLMVKPGDSFRYGLLTALTVGYEVGAVEDLGDRIDELDERLDQSADNLDDAELLQEDFNRLLTDLGDNAYFKGVIGGYIPLMPFIYKTDEYGAFTLSADISASGLGRLLSDEAQLVQNLLNNEYQLNSRTSLYVKNFLDFKVSLGYSNEFYRNEYGSLVAGVRANMHNFTLGKSVIALASATDDEIDDAVEGDIEDNQLDSTGVSFDIGAIWTAPNYQLGLTVTSLNEPSFDYKSVGTSCNDQTDELRRINCLTAAEFAAEGRIAANETHVMNQRATLEAAYYDEAKNWILSASYEANSVNDPVGDEYQWASVAGQFHGDWWIASGLRVGYRTNLVGSELSYASFGATLLKGFNLDISYGLDEVEDIPRSAFISLGFESAF